MKESQSKQPFPFLNFQEQLWQPELVKGVLKIAIPKNGLKGDSLNFLRQYFPNMIERAETNPKTYLFMSEQTKLYCLRQSDILARIDRGKLDFGIAGADTILEAQLNGKDILPIKQLGFGDCMLRMLVPMGQTVNVKTIEKICTQGRIVTGLPETTRYLH